MDLKSAGGLNNTSGGDNTPDKEVFRKIQSSAVIGDIGIYFTKSDFESLKKYSTEKLGDWSKSDNDIKSDIVKKLESDRDIVEKLIKKLIVVNKQLTDKSYEDLFEAVKNIFDPNFKNSHPAYGGMKDVDNLTKPEDFIYLADQPSNFLFLITGYCTHAIKNYMGDALKNAQKHNYNLLSKIYYYFSLIKLIRVLKDENQNLDPNSKNTIKPSEFLQKAFSSLETQLGDTAKKHKNLATE